MSQCASINGRTGISSSYTFPLRLWSSSFLHKACALDALLKEKKDDARTAQKCMVQCRMTGVYQDSVDWLCHKKNTQLSDRLAVRGRGGAGEGLYCGYCKNTEALGN